MTRFARASDGNRKRPLDASEWNELKKDDKKSKKEKTKTKKLKKNKDGKAVKQKVEQTEDVVHHSKAPNEQSDKQTSLESRLRNLSQKKTTELQLQEAYKKVKRSEDRRVKRIQKKQDELVYILCLNLCKRTKYIVLQSDSKYLKSLETRLVFFVHFE